MCVCVWMNGEELLHLKKKCSTNDPGTIWQPIEFTKSNDRVIGMHSMRVLQHTPVRAEIKFLVLISVKVPQNVQFVNKGHNCCNFRHSSRILYHVTALILIYNLADHHPKCIIQHLIVAQNSSQMFQSSRF